MTLMITAGPIPGDGSQSSGAPVATGTAARPSSRQSVMKKRLSLFKVKSNDEPTDDEAPSPVRRSGFEPARSQGPVDQGDSGGSPTVSEARKIPALRPPRTDGTTGGFVFAAEEKEFKTTIPLLGRLECSGRWRT
jgi:hypothetical protein